MRVAARLSVYMTVHNTARNSSDFALLSSRQAS